MQKEQKIKEISPDALTSGLTLWILKECLICSANVASDKTDNPECLEMMQNMMEGMCYRPKTENTNEE